VQPAATIATILHIESYSMTFEVLAGRISTSTNPQIPRSPVPREAEEMTSEVATSRVFT
jgi:hypothetical protein